MRRSKKQEQSAAKRHGARRQKGSGAMDHAKGDFRDPGKVRGECKFTRAKSFSLKLADLMKLEEQATLGERPVFEIEFQGQQPVMRYVVLPGWLYDYYQSLAGD